MKSSKHLISRLLLWHKFWTTTHFEQNCKPKIIELFSLMRAKFSGLLLACNHSWQLFCRKNHLHTSGGYSSKREFFAFKFWVFSWELLIVVVCESLLWPTHVAILFLCRDVSSKDYEEGFLFGGWSLWILARVNQIHYSSMLSQLWNFFHFFSNFQKQGFYGWKPITLIDF
jgi:hypothetical protein